MARRNDIDWEAVERDYIAGALTAQAIADKHGVSDSQVRAKAKAKGWRRDLSEAIRARTRAKVSAIDVAALIEQSAEESASKSAETIKSAIEQAADINLAVTMRHRSYLADSHKRLSMVEALVESIAPQAAGVKDIGPLSQAVKALVDARGKVIEQERKAFGLEDVGAEKAQPATITINI